MIPAFVPPIFMPKIGFVGAGNILPGALAWGGLRAYSLATAGTKAVNLRASGNNATSDFNTLANGKLDTASISTFLTANGGSLFITKLYDQTGNGFDLSQATAANQIPFTLNAIGTLPAMDNTAGANVSLIATATIAQAQPLTFSLVAKKTSGVRGNPCSDIAGAVQVTPGLGGANAMAIYAGAISPAITANDNVWHAFQLIFNNTSSDINVDGTSNIVSAGAAGFTGNALSIMNGAGLPYTGLVGEVGLWAGAFSGAIETAMNSNQHAYWGF